MEMETGPLTYNGMVLFKFHHLKAELKAEIAHLELKQQLLYNVVSGLKVLAAQFGTKPEAFQLAGHAPTATLEATPPLINKERHIELQLHRTLNLILQYHSISVQRRIKISNNKTKKRTRLRSFLLFVSFFMLPFVGFKKIILRRRIRLRLLLRLLLFSRLFLCVYSSRLRLL